MSLIAGCLKIVQMIYAWPSAKCLCEAEFVVVGLQGMILVDNAGGVWPSINHSPWNGVTLADFVMPFFLFIVGVALALTYEVKVYMSCCVQLSSNLTEILPVNRAVQEFSRTHSNKLNGVRSLNGMQFQPISTSF
jgi:predicted acyltransferase